jgi:hypothetical protein
MNAYQWLLVLGFPPTVAAATVLPEIFSEESSTFHSIEPLFRDAA